MTRRGRVTLATLAMSVVLGLGWLLQPFGSIRAALPSAAETAVAAVAREPSAPPPLIAARDGDRPGPAPIALLERLPVTRSALDLPATESADDPGGGRLFERLDQAQIDPSLAGPLRVEYTLDAELTRHVFRVLKRGRVALGNVVLMDPTTGRVLAYASTDIEQFPPTRAYPAASLVKVITAAAALDRSPRTARLPCRYTGSPYRLTPSRIDPPTHGNTVSLRRALATSNNQCFAQLAVHALGADPLMEAIRRFGWLSSPAPAHSAGAADPGGERFDVGRLGCGLAGSHITPLHAVQLASTLAHGELVSPRWVESVVDGQGRVLSVPASGLTRQVLTPDLTRELRNMLVDTTRVGTARRAFRKRGGGPLLGPVAVAGKTGSLDGEDPDGRYEWFIGVAPAESPRIAVATVLVQDDLWWRSASQIAAEVLRGVFCSKAGCSAENASRYIQTPAAAAALARADARPGEFVN